jgi:nucleoside-diphosphate-sugar epimerase
MTGTIGGARVLITGARGFIGQHLAARLLEQGAEVHGTSRSAQIAGDAQLRWRVCDVTDADEVRRLFAEIRPDYAFHLSSLADARRDRDLVIPTFQSGAIATVNILLAASEAGTRRLIIPGSIEEPAPGEVASSPYGAAKAVSRAYARMFHELYQMPVVIARIFMAYGPGQPAWKVLPAAAGCLLRGEAPVIASPGREVDWIYVSDVVAGLLCALITPGLEGRSVDLGSGDLTTIRDIVERLRLMINPSIQPRYSERAPRQREQVCRADAAETLRLMGWRPRIGLDEGLRRTVVAMQYEHQQASAGKRS